MYSRTFRSKVVGSSFTLPVMAVVTSLLWLLSGSADQWRWITLALTALTTYIVVELNNRHALLRIRSRLVSSVFLLFMAASPFLHTHWQAAALMFTFALSYAMLFQTYQRVRAEGYVFHAFLFLGLGSLWFPPMAVMALLYFFSMLFQLRNFTWRTWVAGLLGIAVPYWFYVAYAIYRGQFLSAFDYLQPWLCWERPAYGAVSQQQWVALGVVGFFALVSLVHFFRTAYNDKIRTRMLFYVVVTQECALAAGVAALPHYVDIWLALLLLNSSILIAHYYALARGRFFDFWFNLSLLAVIAWGVYNYLQL